MPAIVEIRVVPNAPRSEVLGTFGSAIRIKVKGVPEKGRANDELIRFLAEVLQIPRSQVSIHSGHAQKTKLVAVEGMTKLQVEEKLGTACGK